MTSLRSAAITAPRLAGPSSPASAESAEHAAPRISISRSTADLRVWLRGNRLRGLTIGLVPTMGALHDGHLSLIEAARRQCDLVVVSLFVNPTQFDEQSDLAAYPRDERRDAELASQAGANLLFAPPPEELYKQGFTTFVEVEGLTDRLEGAIRGRGHFRGVSTIVCKLLNIVQPDFAFFGQKDAQQAAVIRRMVADLDIDVMIETLPTVREPDGLAMSSRNARLQPCEREQALSLFEALGAAKRLAAEGERSSKHLIAVAHEVLASHRVQPQYVELVDRESFETLDELPDEGLLLIAARIGETRLIDNSILRAPSSTETAQRNKTSEPDPRHRDTTPDTPHPERRRDRACSA
jgi:pantoate--beta-alanine ligase